MKLKSDMAVAEIVRLIKSNSSKWLNDSNGPPGRFQWQTGYGAFPVSESQVRKVRKYIQTQESHHAKVSFRNELITLLEKHGIDTTSDICSGEVGCQPPIWAPKEPRHVAWGVSPRTSTSPIHKPRRGDGRLRRNVECRRPFGA